MKRLKRSMKKVFRQRDLNDLCTIVALSYLVNLILLKLGLFHISEADVFILGAIYGFACLMGVLGILFEYKSKFDRSYPITIGILIQLIFEVLLIYCFCYKDFPF